MTTWAVQISGLYYSEQVKIVEAMNDIGVKWVDIAMYPFQDEIIGLDDIPDDERVIFTGSCKLIGIIANDNKWNPGIFFDHDTFNLSAWVANRSDMLNNPTIMKFCDLDNWWEVRRPEHMFVRPHHDLKAFNGIEINDDEFFGWYEHTEVCIVADPRFDITVEVAVSAAVNIEYEWRFFIVDHNVISGSQYMKNGTLSKLAIDEGSDVWNIAQKMAEDWLPADVVVMDVCKTRAGEYKVIEFNCFNGSGFYDNCKRTVFKKVTDYVDGIL